MRVVDATFELAAMTEPASTRDIAAWVADAWAMTVRLGEDRGIEGGEGVAALLFTSMFLFTLLHLEHDTGD